MSKKSKKIIILAVCLLSAGIRVYAYDKGDFQIWNTESESLNIGKGTKFFMEQEFRYGESARELYHQHYDWGFIFGFDRMLDINLGYRLVYEKYKRKWIEEDMPNANATVKLDFWKFKFDDRNRIEYRHFRYRDDFIRYRNKFTLKFPFDFARIKVSPYMSDEIFISSNATGFNENRFFSGIELGLTGYVKADVYYLLKSNRISGDKWTDANVLGTKVKFAF